MDFSAKQWLSQPEVVCQGRSVVVCQVTKRNQLLAGDGDDLVKHYPRHNFITGWSCQRPAVAIETVHVNSIQKSLQIRNLPVYLIFHLEISYVGRAIFKRSQR